MSRVYVSGVSVTPPVSSALHAAEARFKSFFLVSTSMLAVLFAAIFAEQPSFDFWIGRGLISVGTFLILVSLLHGRYFDVMKYVNSRNAQPSTEMPAFWIQAAESCLSYGRMLGFLLLIASRWTVYSDTAPL